MQKTNISRFSNASSRFWELRLTRITGQKKFTTSGNEGNLQSTDSATDSFRDSEALKHIFTFDNGHISLNNPLGL